MIGFQELLKDIGAKDGEIFYDLDCGVGKSVITASLSDIRFIRCVGIEPVHGLYECAKNTILEVKRYLTNPVQNDKSKYGNLNKSVEYGNPNKSIEYGNLSKSVIGGEDLNLSHRKDERHKKNYDINGDKSVMSEGFESHVISNRQLSIAAKSLRGGLPLLEVRYTCEYTYLYIYMMCEYIYVYIYMMQTICLSLYI
jgi:hypothetical protein